MENKYKEKLLGLVAEDKLEMVFLIIKESADQDTLSDISIVEGSFSELKRMEMLSVISPEQNFIQRNKIRKSLTELIRNVNFDTLKPIEDHNNRKDEVIKYSVYYNLLLKLVDVITYNKPKELTIPDSKIGNKLRVIKNTSFKIDGLTNFEYSTIYEHRKLVNGSYWNIKSFHDEILYKINFSITDIDVKSICEQTHIRKSVYGDLITLCIPFKHNIQETNTYNRINNPVKKNTTKELSILLINDSKVVEKINTTLNQIRDLHWLDLPFEVIKRPFGFSCIVQGQEVLTNIGEYELIERIFVKKKLLSFNHQNENLEYSRISDFKIHKTKVYLRINKKLSVTHNHLVYTLEKGYISAKELKYKMKLKNKSGFEEIHSIEEIENEVNVYDISVETNHNFFVNGYLVHNK